MKTKIILPILFVASILFAAENVPTQDIEAKQLTPVHKKLANYTTYMILESSGVDKKFIPDKNVTQREKLTNEINAIINEELKKKGKKAVEKNPEFYVAYSAGIDKEAIESKLEKADRERVHAIPKAAIVLMLADAKSGKLLWMTSAEGDATKLPPEQKQKRIQYAIRKMLQSL